MRVHVVGTGLIGASVGLALADTADVVLSDVSEEHLAEAVVRGAGRRWDGVEAADVLLVCTPPSLTAQLVIDALERRLARTVSHVAGHQSRVQAEVEAHGGPWSESFCGGHPLAGRERSGPGAATARLFVDRPWVVCPTSRTSAAAEAAVTELAEACGAVPVRAAADEHDAAVALVSHLPQVAASAVAARLLDGVGARLDPARLAGPGMQDTTRIAASDPDLWVDVLTRNAGHVAPLVRALSEDLARVAGALEAAAQRTGLQDQRSPAPAAGDQERSGDRPPTGSPDGADATVSPPAHLDAGPRAVLRSLLERGRAGRARLPLKQGRVDAFAEVAVSVPDRPGQLAAVLVAAAEAGVNVEDVHVEHLPGRPRGLVELLVPTGDAERTRRSLRQAGWDVVGAG